MDLQDNEELKAIAELKSMSLIELDLVDYDTVKWCCQGKKCNRGTKIRNYGIAPFYYWNRKQKDAGWINLDNQFFMCAKHWKLWKRLKLKFDEFKVMQKLFDFNKQKIQ